MQISIDPSPLNRQLARRENEARLDDCSWSEELQSWLVFDQELMFNIMRDTRFVVDDSINEIDFIARNLAMDLSATLAMFKQAPIALEGKEHAERRRNMALQITANVELALVRYSNYIDVTIPHIFSKPKSFDIMEVLFRPAVYELMSGLAGVCPAIVPGEPTLPEVFDRRIGPGRRIKIESGIAALVREAQEKTATGNPFQTAALALIGQNALLGTLSLSFAHEIDKNSGVKLRDINWKSSPSVSGLAFVERLATQDVIVAEQHIKSGQRIRLYLDVQGADDNYDRDGYFGAGRHICLGKALSLRAWQKLIEKFGDVDRYVKIDEPIYRRDDAMFTQPSKILVMCYD